MVTFIGTLSEQQIKQTRLLFIECARSLDFDLGFQNFKKELDELPGEYAPPAGVLILAMDGERPVGCVALRKLEEGICEMKRLFVRPEHRGKKIGRMLAEMIIQIGRVKGYKKMRLDTVPSMAETKRLYHELGFIEIEPYRFNPIPGATYMELDLK